jgi:hypothetical protein
VPHRGGVGRLFGQRRACSSRREQFVERRGEWVRRQLRLRFVERLIERNVVERDEQLGGLERQHVERLQLRVEHQQLGVLRHRR